MRESTLRRFVWSAGFTVALAGYAAVGALAQNYPLKPIRLLVGFPPGGGADNAARVFEQKLSAHDSLGQPIIIDNRPGASGAIATEAVAKAPADGYTLSLLTFADTVQPALRAKLPYDLERDLAPVCLLGTTPYVLVVHPSVPARNAAELIALARSRPDELNYGTSGVGTPAHLLTELFNSMAKVKITQVPYRGSGQYSVAIVSGEVHMSFISASAGQTLVAANKIRALAMSSAKRSSLMPSVPTLNESGLPGYDMAGSWFGVVAPAGVAKNIVARLNAAIGKVASTAEVKDLLNKQGIEAQATTPEQFAALIRNETALNTKLIRAIGIKAE